MKYNTEMGRKWTMAQCQFVSADGVGGVYGTRGGLTFSDNRPKPQEVTADRLTVCKPCR
jgi:hypothetical protein